MRPVATSGSHRRDVLAARLSVPQTPGGVAELLTRALSEDGRPRETARLLIQAALRLTTDLQHHQDELALRDGTACCAEPDCDCEPDVGEILCRGHILAAAEREAARAAQWLETCRLEDAARALEDAVEVRPPLALPAPSKIVWRRCAWTWHAVDLSNSYRGTAICGSATGIASGDRQIAGLPACERCVKLLANPQISPYFPSAQRVLAVRIAA